MTFDGHGSVVPGGNATTPPDASKTTAWTCALLAYAANTLEMNVKVT